MFISILYSTTKTALCDQDRSVNSLELEEDLGSQTFHLLPADRLRPVLKLLFFSFGELVFYGRGIRWQSKQFVLGEIEQAVGVFAPYSLELRRELCTRCLASSGQQGSRGPARTHLRKIAFRPVLLLSAGASRL